MESYETSHTHSWPHSRQIYRLRFLPDGATFRVQKQYYRPINCYKYKKFKHTIRTAITSVVQPAQLMTTSHEQHFLQAWRYYGHLFNSYEAWAQRGPMTWFFTPWLWNGFASYACHKWGRNTIWSFCKLLFLKFQPGLTQIDSNM